MTIKVKDLNIEIDGEDFEKLKDANLSIGHYNNERDAAMAYDVAAKKYFGEFARLNFEGQRK